MAWQIPCLPQVINDRVRSQCWMRFKQSLQLVRQLGIDAAKAARVSAAAAVQSVNTEALEGIQPVFDRAKTKAFNFAVG